MGLTLHNLVTLREELISQYKIDSITSEIKKLQNQLAHLIKVDGYVEYVNDQIEFYQNILDQVTSKQLSVQTTIDKINTDIEVKKQELFYGNYENELLYEMTNHEVRLNRDYKINDDSKEVLLKRIRSYTDFHYPTLELGCRVGTWTNYLVAGDPLYLVDLDQSFINATIGQFNEVYRNRVRPYVVNLFQPGEKNLNILPQNQFGFIFSWEFFNYLPLSTLEYYLEQFYELLRPGGIALIRFNNGDTPLGSRSAEIRWQSYISGKELIAVSNKLGFEVIQIENINLGETSWIEIKKPGELKTVKASQSLGAIKEKID